MKNIWICILAMLIATTGAVNGQTKSRTEDSIPLNLLPMYGYPDREKPDHLKESDEEFIKEITAKVPREEASDYYAAKGWAFASKGDYATAMRRFNQAWLLNPDSYKPYLGFGQIELKQQGDFAEAVTYFEKALSLVDEENKIRDDLLIETARTHMILGVMTRTNSTDKTESDKHFGRSNELFNESQMLFPKNTKMLSLWAKSLYWQGNYEKAWDMAEKARSLGHDFKPEFIDSLSEKMPKPERDDL